VLRVIHLLLCDCPMLHKLHTLFTMSLRVSVTCCCAFVAAACAAVATPWMCCASAMSSMFWFLVSHTCVDEACGVKMWVMSVGDEHVPHLHGRGLTYSLGLGAAPGPPPYGIHLLLLTLRHSSTLNPKPLTLSPHRVVQGMI